jgi:hypothetical protein
LPEIYVHEERPLEVGPAQKRTLELCAGQVRAVQTCVGQVDAREVGAAKIGLVQAGSLERSLDKLRARQERALEARVREVRAVEAGVGEIGLLEVRLDEMSAAEVDTLQIPSAAMRYMRRRGPFGALIGSPRHSSTEVATDDEARSQGERCRDETDRQRTIRAVVDEDDIGDGERYNKRGWSYTKNQRAPFLSCRPNSTRLLVDVAARSSFHVSLTMTVSNQMA